MIEFVSATRLPKKDFLEKSPLGASLRRLAFDKRLTAHIACENRRGLPEVYNQRILSAQGTADVLVFVHDDVWIDDCFIGDRVLEGLKAFDVIGVAGNRRRLGEQPSWAFIDERLTWDQKDNLSGAVAHGQAPFGAVSHYGASPAPCELLDGVFLAARKSTLLEKNALFDPRFDFHFYDLDFCRQARQQGLRLGTWPIAITHQSGGAFGSPAWRQAHQRYVEKWRPGAP